MRLSINEVLTTPLEKLVNVYNFDGSDVQLLREAAESYWNEPETAKALTNKANELEQWCMLYW